MQFRNRGPAVGQIRIYGDIGEGFFGGISAESFAAELAQLGPVSQLEVFINSDGGDVFTGVSVYNQLRRHAATVNVTVDGVAASIASVIAMAGDTVELAQGAFLMLHAPYSGMMGRAEDFRDRADALDAIQAEMVGIYARRAGDDARDWLEDATSGAGELWLTAERAVELGLADGIGDAVAVAACLSRDWDALPDEIAGAIREERQLEEQRRVTRLRSAIDLRF